MSRHAPYAARPISSVYSYRGLVNRLRRFDELERPTPGFVALGDVSLKWSA